MSFGFINPNTFGERLAYLMEKAGIDPNQKSAESILSVKMYESGIIEYNDRTGDDTSKAKQRDNTRKVISKHLKLDSAEDLSGKWLQRYCKYFNCSADFLLGYIPLPTHENSNISDVTGLSENAIQELKKHNDNKNNLELFVLSEMISSHPKILSIITDYFIFPDSDEQTTDYHLDSRTGKIVSKDKYIHDFGELKFIKTSHNMPINLSVLRNALLSYLQEELLNFKQQYSVKYTGKNWIVQKSED